MALRSAVEAHSVHRNVGHLLWGNLHLWHNKSNEMKRREERELHHEEQRRLVNKNTFSSLQVSKYDFDSNTQRHSTFTQQITINWHKNHKGVTNITQKHEDKHSKTRQHKWVTAVSPQNYIHNVQTQNTQIPNSLKLKPIQHRTTHPTGPGTEATNWNQQKNSKVTHVNRNTSHFTRLSN